MRAAVPITDIFTGLYAAIGVLAAVIHHRQTGEGQYIDAAMIDVTTAINGHLALGYLMTGTVPKREGNNNPITAPSEVFRGADGYFSMSAGNNGQFANLLATLGIGAATAQDPRFVNNIERIRHRKELHEILEAQTVQQPVMRWIDTLSAANVPCAPIYDMQQLLADPHVQGRELVLQVPHASGVDVPVLRSPLRLSASPVKHKAPPMLGQHTNEVLSRSLGKSTAEIEQLRRARVI